MFKDANKETIRNHTQQSDEATIELRRTKMLDRLCLLRFETSKFILVDMASVSRDLGFRLVSLGSRVNNPAHIVNYLTDLVIWFMVHI